MFELPKAYEAKSVDSKWAQFWEQHNFFKVNALSQKPAYCIVMPPPNVTGVLHMGHALVNTLQDLLIRWKRMSGFESLWVPGVDHAGIATQTVVERHLIATMGKRRKDFSREEFLSHVWRWKEEKEHIIIDQLKRLGCSCDWSRYRFTMDEGCSHAVRAMFKKMFDDNLIYRGEYLVNWDPMTQTALADEEIEYEERQSFFWYIRYPFTDGSGHIVVATTRPETLLGDTAIAVSPKDERYAHLIGKTVTMPFVGRSLPIIADHHVDATFGTGMVKITPAHDPNDYQIGLRHKLPFITIMTPDGRINEKGGEFQGLTMEEARVAIVEKMKSLGLIEKIAPHTLRVGLSYRSKAVIEPYLSKQWFIRVENFAKKLSSAVKEGKVKIIPKNWEHTYFHWIDNLRDWCISRQLWWGHQIPIWYNKADPSKMICYDKLGTPPEVLAAPDQWEQDPDALDTWFSSGLWPFSTLGWPNKTEDLQKFYPNSVLVTGHDILFFWVARMILMGEYAMEEVPFRETFIHGLIYGRSYWRQQPEGGVQYVKAEERLEYDLGKPTPKDVFSKWEKLSKSKGNVIDPLELIDQYGTDAMRMALCASSPQSTQIDLDRRRFEEFKNFTNKIWNGARFIFMNFEGQAESETAALTAEAFSQGLDESLLTLEDKWILSVLNRTIRDVNAKLAIYEFDQAALAAYDFYWKELCAYYLEIAKPTLFGKVGSAKERQNKQKILAIVLCNAVRLLHPMAPFITEELFQLLKERLKGVSELPGSDPYTTETIRALQSAACAISPYPQVIRAADIDPEINETFALMEQIIYTIRNIRGEMKLPPGTATDVFIVGSGSDPQLRVAKKNQAMISALVRTKAIEVTHAEPKSTFSCTGVVGNLKIVIPLPEDQREKELVRLGKEKKRLEKALEKLRGQLDNQEFVQNAPPELVAKQKALFEQSENELASIRGKLKTEG